MGHASEGRVHGGCRTEEQFLGARHRWLAPESFEQLIEGHERVCGTAVRPSGGGFRKERPAMHDVENERPLDKTWQDYSNCLGVDPDLFFPERGASTREAKEVCRGCVVREDCLEYALNNGEKFGIWGGMSERERRRIRRQRALARAAAAAGA